MIEAQGLTYLTARQPGASKSIVQEVSSTFQYDLRYVKP